MENPGGQKRKFFPSPTGGNVLLSVLIFFFLSFVVRGEQFIELQSEILNKTHSPYPSRLPLLE